MRRRLRILTIRLILWNIDRQIALHRQANRLLEACLEIMDRA